MRTLGQALILVLFAGLVGSLPAGAAEKKKAAKQAVESCIAGGSKEAKFRLGSSGFADEDMSIVEGVSGPELRVGNTRIFLNAGSSVDASQAGTSDSKNNQWCIIDPALAKQRSLSPDKPICGLPIAANGKDKGEPVPIRGKDGQVIGELHAIREKGSDGKWQERLLLKPQNSGSRDVHNQIHITGQALKTGNKTTSQIRIESRNKNGDAVNGVAESSMSGYMDDSSKENDPMSGYRMKGCISDNQAKGQLRQKDEESDNWVDLSGSHIVMRGKETYGVDQYKKQEDKSPQYMTDSAGRSGTR